MNLLDILKAILSQSLNPITTAVKAVSLGAAALAGYAWYQGHAADVVYVLHVDDACIIACILYALFQAAHAASPSAGRW